MQNAKPFRTGSFSGRSIAGLVFALLLFGGLSESIYAAPAPSAPGELSASYLIGPGDSLQIFVWKNPDLSTSVPVRPDGRISIPLVEDIDCAGKTPTQLARDIEARLECMSWIQPLLSSSVGSLDPIPSRFVLSARRPSPKPYPIVPTCPFLTP